jgi:hypothetical protein
VGGVRVPKRAAKKMGKTQKCVAKERSSSTEREETPQKKKGKRRKKRKKVERENVDSLTLGHNGVDVTERVAATTAAASQPAVDVVW